MKGSLLIQGGTVLSEHSAVLADVLINGEQIVAVAAPGQMQGSVADKVLDASGMLVMPGGVDPHVHISRKLQKADDFYTGSCAALAGGTTSVLDFCEPDAGESAAACIADRKARGAASAVDYGFHFAFTENYRNELLALDTILAEGLSSFKVFTCYENTTLDRGDLLHIFRMVRDAGPVLVHAEAEDLCRICEELLADSDPTDFMNHAKARPALAEQLCVQDIRTLAEETGAAACIAHLSTAAGLNILGDTLSAETCPHYLQFTSDALKRADGMLYTMTPALRSEADVRALWKALCEGGIGMFSTDHCAFSKASKTACTDWRQVPNGVGGIQQRMHYLFSEGVVKRGMSMTRFVSLTSANAARYYGLWPRKGCIAPGSDGDVVLLDPACRWRFSKEDIAGAEDYSLYEGMEFTGRIRKVVSRGSIVYDETGLHAEKGRGKYLPRIRGGTGVVR